MDDQMDELKSIDQPQLDVDNAIKIVEVVK